MNKKDAVMLITLLNTLIDMNVDIDEYLPKQKQEQFIKMFEKRYPQLIQDKNIKEAMLKELERYVKMIK